MAKGKAARARARIAQGGFTIPSPEEVRAAASGSGGWTAEQLAEWGVSWPPPKGWRERLEARWRRSRPSISGRDSVATSPRENERETVIRSAAHSQQLDRRATRFLGNAHRDVRSVKRAKHLCAVCGEPAGEFVVTRGITPEGTLRAFWFCGQPHVDEWKAANPFPGPVLTAEAPI